MKILKKIFSDKFEEFWDENKRKYPENMRKHIYAEVMKMITCGTGVIGYVIYMCLRCGKEIKVGFTCKSRFCNKCGQKYIKEWVEKQVKRILNVPHRHCVFTVPVEFRIFFYENRKYLKDLQDMAYKVIEEHANGVNKRNRKEYEKKKRRKQGDLLWKVGVIDQLANVKSFLKKICSKKKKSIYASKLAIVNKKRDIPNNTILVKI